MTTYHRLTDASGTWKVSLQPPDERPEGANQGSEAICMLDDIETVLVRSTSGRLNTPGGRAEEGESSDETMIREVREEACAEVTSWQLLGYARSECLEGERPGHVMVRDMYIARVQLMPWHCTDEETMERLIVPLDDLPPIMAVDWPGLDDFSAELVALAKVALADI
jgi:8-oxo-dGTP pyrophosphatase MutT (NUDIX family)